jgi:hypothetical protein
MKPKRHTYRGGEKNRAKIRVFRAEDYKTFEDAAPATDPAPLDALAKGRAEVRNWMRRKALKDKT